MRKELIRPDFKLNHTLYWGKLYRSTEFKPEWRVPSTDDIEMAFEIIKIADECATQLGELLDHRAFSDKIWTNKFCRAVNCIDKVLRGSYSLIADLPNLKTDGRVAET